MQIFRATDRPSVRTNPHYFTGTVWLDPIAVPTAPSRLRAIRVSFEPGARTAWHTHPLGQVIHILAGVARVQREGAPVQVATAGDTVAFGPGERHWHGAAPTHTMVHLAMQESGDDGTDATWLEAVTDSEYNATA